MKSTLYMRIVLNAIALAIHFSAIAQQDPTSNERYGSWCETKSECGKGLVCSNNICLDPASAARQRQGVLRKSTTTAASERPKQANVRDGTSQVPAVGVNSNAATNRMKPRPLTKEDGLKCSFSQDVATSMGIVINGLADSDYIDPTPPNSRGSGYTLSGTMWSKANHFKCTDNTGKEIEIELLNKVPKQNVDISHGRVVIVTKDFGTLYRSDQKDEKGKFIVFEMTDSQIKDLAKFLGF